MRVIILKEPELSEDYVEIHCAEKNGTIQDLADYIASRSQKLTGKYNGETRLLILEDIYYFESVDKKTFAYTKESVWAVEMTLKEAEENFSISGFVRISKSVVVNIYKVELLKNDFEMRVLLKIENGETLILNRHYRRNFQNSLEKMKQLLKEGKHETNS